MIDQLPQQWTLSEYTTEFFGVLASTPFSLLLLDYDGTLAPFTPYRQHALPYPGVRDRLERLLAIANTRVVLITGRKALELRDLLHLSQPVEIWGSHGREHLRADNSYEMEQLTFYELAALDQVREALAQEFGTDVMEVKPNSVAVHWRGAQNGGHRDPNYLSHRLEQLYRELPQAQPGDGVLQLLDFDGGLELRAGGVNKGHAVKRIIDRFTPGTPAAFLGDDITDEDAFAVLRERGLAVLVRSEPRETMARLWLSPPGDLLHFMDAWIEAAEARR